MQRYSKSSYSKKSNGHSYGMGNNNSSSSMVKILVATLCCLACIGIFLSASLIPHDSPRAPSTNSIIRNTESKSLSSKILDWIPRSNAEHVPQQLHHVHVEILPKWDEEQFWTPIDIDVSDDSMVILCKLNFKKYWQSPHSSPMFRDLETMSNCIGNNRRREKMSVLLAEIKAKEGTPAGRVIPPTGFVFHESRVGSTLIANLLASDPHALVFSESTPIANAILHCDSCSREKHLQLFRDVLTLMGNSPMHNKMFVKLQSITSTKMEIALEAFPDTPWVFVFRQPVQTMMSHLDPEKGAMNSPCLRSKRSPPPAVRAALSLYKIHAVEQSS